MTVMSQKLRKEVEADPEYDICAFLSTQGTFGPCGGRVTREHAIIYANKKVQKKWAIIPCCARHHGVDEYQDAHTEVPKDARVCVALNRATDEELLEYPRANFISMRVRLNKKYGAFK